MKEKLQVEGKIEIIQDQDDIENQPAEIKQV